jgi:phosphatidate cytidylyltransferase
VGGLDVYHLVPGGGRSGLVGLAWALATVSMAGFLVEMGRFRQAGRATVHLGLTLLAAAYVGLLGGFFVQLRLLSPGSRGLLALASLIVVVKAGDVGAYVGGRVAGRRKLAPWLSPGKTWEGAVSGLVLAVLGGQAVFFGLRPWAWPECPPPSVAAVAGYGAVTALAGMFGDLAESLLKRDLGRKDSSDWLPGFGGVLDLIDSLLFSAPVAYAFWTTGLLG